MTRTETQNAEQLAEVLQDAARNLNPRAISLLAAHPDAVRSALAVAADALSTREGDEKAVEVIGGGESPRVAPAVAEARLAGRTNRGPEETLLSSDELAARIGLKTRQSVHDWLKSERIVGWQGAKRGYVFPADQFDDRGRPPEGLERILPHFEDAYGAWIWLTTPLAALNGERPLERLRAGDIDQVVAAAEGDAQGDFA